MSDSNDIVLREDNDYSLSPRSVLDITPTQYDLLNRIAKVYASSIFSGSKNRGTRMTPEDAFVALMLGIELGFKPMSALQHISVIQGKPSLDGKGMLAVIHASGQLKEMKIEGDDKKCTITMTRVNGVSHTSSYTIEEAKSAGLVKDGGGWVKYPARMLEWRCVAFCARIVFADIIGGVYTPEEISTGEVEVYEDGGMIVVAEDENRPLSENQVKALKKTMLEQLVSEGHYATVDEVREQAKSYNLPLSETSTREGLEALYNRLVKDAEVLKGVAHAD
jgi:hypothetical protein